MTGRKYVKYCVFIILKGETKEWEKFTHLLFNMYYYLKYIIVELIGHVAQKIGCTIVQFSMYNQSNLFKLF